MSADQEKIAQIDQRLDILGEEIVQLRNQQQTNTNRITSLGNLTTELLDIARLHQQGLRILQVEMREMRSDMREMRSDMREMRSDMREMQAEIRQIWQYLLEQRGNGQQS